MKALVLKEYNKFAHEEIQKPQPQPGAPPDGPSAVVLGPIDELYGYWANLNDPYIEVEDTAVAVIRFKNGGVGNIVVSNS